MQVVVRESLTTQAPPERVFELIASEEGFLSFSGFGPIPGLQEVRFDSGSYTELGSTTRVTNTDGSTHRERIIECDRPRRYALRIHSLSSPFRLLVHHIDERWRIEPHGSGSRIHRSFAFELRSVALWPLSLPIGQVLFRAAIRRHHRVVGARLDGGSR